MLKKIYNRLFPDLEKEFDKRYKKRTLATNDEFDQRFGRLYEYGITSDKAYFENKEFWLKQKQEKEMKMQFKVEYSPVKFIHEQSRDYYLVSENKNFGKDIPASWHKVYTGYLADCYAFINLYKDGLYDPLSPPIQ